MNELGRHCQQGFQQDRMYHSYHRSGNGQGKKKFFKVREKSGNVILSQGKLIFLRKVREN